MKILNENSRKIVYICKIKIFLVLLTVNLIKFSQLVIYLFFGQESNDFSRNFRHDL